MDWKGAFLGLEGALLHSLPKSEGTMAPLAPLAPLAPWFLHPCTHYLAGTVIGRQNIPNQAGLFSGKDL